MSKKPTQTNLFSFFQPKTAASTSNNGHSNHGQKSQHTPPANRFTSPVRSTIQSQMRPPSTPNTVDSDFSSTLSDMPVSPLLPSSLSTDDEPVSDLPLTGRKRRAINYAEIHSDDDDAPILAQASKSRSRARPKKLIDDDDDDDEFVIDDMVIDDDTDGGNDGGEEFIDGDDNNYENEEISSRKKKRSSPMSAQSKSWSPALTTPTSASSSSFEQFRRSSPAFTTTPTSAPKSRKAQSAVDAEIAVDETDELAQKPPAQKRAGSSYDPEWLHEDKIKDAKGRLKSHPDYDNTTLFVPPAAWRSMKPAETQFWELKSKSFDQVFLFKIGKFYEMFDMDADIGVRDLGLSYMMKQERPHAGFPEHAYDKYAAMLVKLGHRVARVEQMQTPEELKKENANKGRGEKKDKVVRREVCQVLTPTTVLEPDMIDGYHAHYILAIVERTMSTEEQQQQSNPLPLGGRAVIEIGVCFSDPSTGKIHVGQFMDDSSRSQLSTLLGLISPDELIVKAGNLSDTTMIVLRSEVSAQCFKQMWKLNGDHFYDASRTYEQVKQQRYFFKSTGDSDDSEMEEWPPVLLKVLELKSELAFSAFGGLLNVFEKTMIARRLLCQNKFELYTPQSTGIDAKFLVLDHKTLANLEIVKDSEGKSAGSLLAYVDQCVSAMGHRAMRKWVCQPLITIAAINDRLNGVEFLMTNAHYADQATQILRSLPDLERLIAVLTSYSIKKSNNEIMYGNVETKKLIQFENILKSLKKAAKIRSEVFDGVNEEVMKSKQLALVTTKFPDIEGIVDHFLADINFDSAKKEGCIKPTRGVLSEYDDACDRVQECEAALADYLVEIKQKLRVSSIDYKHVQSNRYTIELPKSKDVPRDWKLVSSTKTASRYHTQQLTKLLIPALEEAEIAKENIEKDSTRRIYSQFVSHAPLWNRTVRALSELDCLCALARVSASQHAACGHSVRPQFIEFNSERGAVLSLKEAVHPVLATHFNQGSFIPNSTLLGCQENKSRFVLLSGPNMGGKSTLLRQTCCAVILAQLGCFVPAEECHLTPVDRIFTRVGANDAIMAGQSTFLVELTETATIVRHATPRSLVILDELGRGTSTFDGTAIAWSVTKYLLDHIDCLTLFSTHYHRLLQEFRHDPRVSMYHMACTEPQGNNSDSDDIVFLYQFVQGECPESHGLNVARMARLPQSVIEAAKNFSNKFEDRLQPKERRVYDINEIIAQMARARISSP